MLIEVKWMYIKEVRSQSVRRIFLIICEINLFVNTVVRWVLDMMFHYNYFELHN